MTVFLADQAYGAGSAFGESVWLVGYFHGGLCSRSQTQNNLLKFSWAALTCLYIRHPGFDQPLLWRMANRTSELRREIMSSGMPLGRLDCGALADLGAGSEAFRIVLVDHPKGPRFPLGLTLRK